MEEPSKDRRKIKNKTERQKRDRKIYADFKDGMTYRAMAAKYDLNVKTVFEIVARAKGTPFVKKRYRKERLEDW